MISNPDLTCEYKLWPACKHIAGLDEAGRGALAGPVCVGAVILPDNDPHLTQTLSGVRDSKQLTPRKRLELAPRIKESARSWGIGFASANEIDSLGIVPATRLAAGRALEMLAFFPDFLLTDFRLELPELDIPQAALVKGDQHSLSIAAASILAKTARDEFMRELGLNHPEYGFSKHKGYGTLLHREKIAALGYSPIHRKTFKIRNFA
ncbi:MAG: ribonuclease HII [Chloroflexi bacterium]|nr:ribonuclease HII [Chloroflexota bacterium]MBI5963041.1 ribonuclease HII [Chloroflexota bacterium]